MSYSWITCSTISNHSAAFSLRLCAIGEKEGGWGEGEEHVKFCSDQPLTTLRWETYYHPLYHWQDRTLALPLTSLGGAVVISPTPPSDFQVQLHKFNLTNSITILF